MTILSSRVAADAGVAPLVPDTLEAVTATGRVAAQPAVVRRLELGALAIENNSAMIVNADQLVLSRGDSGRVYVDGIIGFDAIRRLDLELDYPAGVATVRRPAAPDSATERARNLFWLGYPLVRLAAADGTPVHFGLDTGAQESYASVPLVAKAHARTYLGERRDVGGFGKAVKVQGRFIKRLRLQLRGSQVRLERVFVYVTQSPTFFTLDGMLGGDVGAGGVVRIDMTNGVFAVRRSAGRPAEHAVARSH
jgi:Aspartyl protease